MPTPLNQINALHLTLTVQTSLDSDIVGLGHQLDVFFSGDSPILSEKNHTLAVLKSDD